MNSDNLFNRIKMTEGTWAVICLGGPNPDPDYPQAQSNLATRSGFATREDAVRYAATINPSWRPMVAKLEAP